MDSSNFDENFASNTCIEVKNFKKNINHRI